ncbi:hypothetical protein ACOME3_004148 [Neoechinorhynchus agilis]
MAVSRTLGPQIVWIKYTMTHDFADFVKLALVVMFAGAVTINAIIYPFWPYNKKLFERAFLRAFFALFLTEKGDIEAAGTGECASYVPHGPVSRGYCYHQIRSVSSTIYSDRWGTSASNISYNCAHESSFGWMLLVQYFILVKLFLLTILYAMFNNSYASISEYSSLVWMFKRYENVTSIKNASPLPPPLNTPTDVHARNAFMCVNVCRFRELIKRLKTKFGNSRFISRLPSLIDSIENENYRYSERKHEDGTETIVEHNHTEYETVYWRLLAQEYASKVESGKDKVGEASKYSTTDALLVSQDKQIKRLCDKVSALQQSITTIQNHLNSSTAPRLVRTERIVGAIPKLSPMSISAQTKVYGHRYYDPVRLKREVNWNGMDHIQTSCCGPLLIDRRSWVYRNPGVRVTYVSRLPSIGEASAFYQIFIYSEKFHFE